MKDERINVAISLGITSVIAASHLSSQASKSVVVKWPKSQSVAAPLRLHVTGDPIRWGHECPLSGSSTYWGITQVDGNEAHRGIVIHDEILRKRGDYYSVPRGSYHDEGLGKVFKLILQYTDLWIRRTYRGAALLPKTITVVVPPYLSYFASLDSFQSFFGHNTISEFPIIQFTHQIYGALESYKIPKLVSGDSIIYCYTEDEITSIVNYEVSNVDGDGVPRLQERSVTVLTSGAWDLVENFVRIVELKHGAIRSINTLQAVRDAFLSKLKAGRIKNMRISGVSKSITIQPEDLEHAVYRPVFSNVANAVVKSLRNSSQKQYIILSGILAECSYLHSYVESKIEESTLRGEIAFLETSSMESSGFCEGAAIFQSHRNTTLVLENDGHAPTIDLIVVERKPPHPCFVSSERLSHIRHLEDKMHAIAIEYNFYSESSLDSLLLLRDQFKALDAIDLFTARCRDIYDKFCQKQKDLAAHQPPRPNPEEPDFFQDETPSLFHATRSANTSVVRLGILSGYPINVRSRSSHALTPLHACIFFNNDPRAIVKALLDAGAHYKGFAHDCPLHLATVRNEIEILRLFEAHDGPFFKELAPDLLQLALATPARPSATYLIQKGVAEYPHESGCFSSFSPTSNSNKSQQDTIFRDPLLTSLSYEWVHEATLILSTRWPRFGHSSEWYQHSIQLLERWVDIDPFYEVAAGMDALYWALEWGCTSLARAIVSTSEGSDRIVPALQSAAPKLHRYELLLSLDQLSENQFIRLWQTKEWNMDSTFLATLVSKTPALRDWESLTRPNESCAFLNALDLSFRLKFELRVSLLLSLLGHYWNDDHLVVYNWATKNERVDIIASQFSRVGIPNIQGAHVFNDFGSSPDGPFRWACEYGHTQLAQVFLPEAFSHLARSKQLFSWASASELESDILGKHCLKIMDVLHKDLCDVRSSGKSISKLTGDDISKGFTPELRFACLNFLKFTLHSNSSSVLPVFFRKHFLHWCEALLLLVEVKEGYHQLRTLVNLSRSITPFPFKHLSSELLDAMEFLAHCSRIASEHPLRVYEDAIVTAPRNGFIFKNYHSHLRDIPLTRLRNQPRDRWHPFPQVFRNPIDDDGILRIILSPDGKELATFFHLSPQIRLWNFANGTLFHLIETSTDYVQYLSTGQLATTDDRFGTVQVRIWNTSSGKCEDTIILKPPGGISSIAFSHNCQLLAMGHYNGEVTLWDRARRRKFRSFHNHELPVRSIRFDTDTHISTSSRDQTIRLTNFETGSSVVYVNCTSLSDGYPDFHTCSASSQDSKFFATRDQSWISIWDIKESSKTAIVNLVLDISSLAYSTRDEKLVICCRWQNRHYLVLWDHNFPAVLEGLCVTDMQGTLDLYPIGDDIKITFLCKETGFICVWSLTELKHELKHLDTTMSWDTTRTVTRSHDMSQLSVVLRADYGLEEQWDKLMGPPDSTDVEPMVTVGKPFLLENSSQPSLVVTESESETAVNSSSRSSILSTNTLIPSPRVASPNGKQGEAMHSSGMKSSSSKKPKEKQDPKIRSRFSKLINVGGFVDAVTFSRGN